MFQATFTDGTSGVFVSTAVAALPADYTLWRDSLGATGTGLAADGNGDSVVDALDFEVWRANLGQTAAAEPLTAQVPEPASGVAMLLLAALAVAIGRRAGGR